jgi:hypothetical protein
VLALLNSARARLLDDERLVGQICALERRTRPGGHDTVDHPVGGRDDVANAALGALLRARPGRVFEGNIRDYAMVAGERVTPRADWQPGHGEPGSPTRLGDPGHFTSGGPPTAADTWYGSPWDIWSTGGL